MDDLGAERDELLHFSTHLTRLASGSGNLARCLCGCDASYVHRQFLHGSYRRRLIVRVEACGYGSLCCCVEGGPNAKVLLTIKELASHVYLAWSTTTTPYHTKLCKSLSKRSAFRIHQRVSRTSHRNFEARDCIWFYPPNLSFWLPVDFNAYTQLLPP